MWDGAARVLGTGEGWVGLGLQWGALSFGELPCVYEVWRADLSERRKSFTCHFRVPLHLSAAACSTYQCRRIKGNGKWRKEKIACGEGKKHSSNSSRQTNFATGSLAAKVDLQADLLLRERRSFQVHFSRVSRIRQNLKNSVLLQRFVNIFIVGYLKCWCIYRLITAPPLWSKKADFSHLRREKKPWPFCGIDDNSFLIRSGQTKTLTFTAQECMPLCVFFLTLPGNGAPHLSLAFPVVSE